MVDMGAKVQLNTTNGGRRRVKREPLAPGTVPPLFDDAMAAFRAQVRLPTFPLPPSLFSLSFFGSVFGRIS